MSKEEFCARLREAAAAAGMALADVQLLQFYRYYELLLEWNDRINLTAITEPQEVINKHFVDSLTVRRCFENASETFAATVIDVGSGAGFPGIPLKILFPELRLTLLDSLNKRLKFLKAVCDELGLKDVELVHGRAEETGRDKARRGHYDYAVARAVARLNVLSELCLPLVKTGGLFIAQKGPAADEELQGARQALSLLGGELSKVIKLEIPGVEGERALIMIRKARPTAAAYPRKPGTPERSPL